MDDTKLWQQLTELFDRVVDMNPSERELEYLAAGASAELRAKVEKLVAADGLADDTSQSMVTRAFLQVAIEQREPTQLDEIIDGYEVLEELGSGGQGVVYLARRTGDELRGYVAIKVLQGQLAGPSQQRFLRERLIHSGLEHPNIVRVLDAGTTSNGSPYLVMELVRGQPILKHCESQGLDLRQRLELFCQAATAVQAAHRQLIIHRDLKNNNILVTEEGIPKLLDFGIAKLLDPESSLAETRPGSHHLTPEAASPEQVLGETLTTSTDIYSLGLLLYRLLAEKPAFVFERNTPLEIHRVVCTTEPSLPSMASGRRELRGDLDAIVLQALQKQPDQRYSSVEALVEDIRRYQRQEPVRARAAGWTYRAVKFLKRHYKPLLSAAAVLILSTLFMFKIRSERDRALAMEGVLLGIFETADLELGIEAIINQATLYLGQLDEQPGIRAQLMTTLGWIYRSLGRYDEAGDILETGLKVRRDLYGESHMEIADNLYRIGILNLEIQDFQQAEEALKQAHLMASALRGENDWLVANCLSRLAEVEYELGRFEAAGKGAEKAMKVRNRILAGRSPTVRQAVDLADNLNLMAGFLYQQERYSEAESTLLQALTTLTQTVGPDRLGVSDLWNSLGMVQRKQNRLDEAVASLQEAARIDRRLLGDKSIRLGIRLLNLGNTYRRQGKTDQALDSCEQARSMTIELGGEQHGNLPRIERCLQRAREAQAGG